VRVSNHGPEVPCITGCTLTVAGGPGERLSIAALSGKVKNPHAFIIELASRISNNMNLRGIAGNVKHNCNADIDLPTNVWRKNRGLPRPIRSEIR
jgi:hypothetical protein